MILDSEILCRILRSPAPCLLKGGQVLPRREVFVICLRKFRCAAVYLQHAPPLMANYQHSKLEGAVQFRLLKLLGGQDGPVRCEFIISSLSSPLVDFVAISYAWGDPKATQEIFCDGKRLV